MGKIIFLMGKSSSGKDTMFKRLLGREDMELSMIVPYTTRPIRADEEQGTEYNFTDDAGYESFLKQGKIIEARAYHTYHGMWRYFTVDDGQIHLNEKDYLVIGTLESFLQTAEYFGRDKLLPILIELDDGIRLQRALDREKLQVEPKYQELCRRFLADEEDFSKEKLDKARILVNFYNGDLERCESDIIDYIRMYK